MDQPLSQLFVSACADVHPPLFYFMAKALLSLCGLQPSLDPQASILLLRLFCIFPICLLSLLGYTHIRRLFGCGCGLLFSLFVGFAPSTFYYTLQIRMYSWAALFVFCAFLASYSILQTTVLSPTKKASRRSWICMAFFTLLAAYTHYYALAAAATLQIFLLPLAWKRKRDLFLPWCLTALSQLLLYIPGFLLLYRQATAVAQGFWITIQYPEVLKEILTFFQQGALFPSLALKISGILFGLLLLLAIITRRFQSLPVKKAILSCLLPILFVCGSGLLLSLFRPVFLPRYLFPMCGLYWLLVALLFSSVQKKWIPILFSFVLLFLGTKSATIRLDAMMKSENAEWKETIEANLTPEDAFFFSDLNVGCQAAVFFAQHPLYFYNEFSWNEKNGRMGFSSLMDRSPEELANAPVSRLWIIDSEKTDLTARLPDNYSCILSKTYHFHPYSGQWIHLSLWQKNENHSILISKCNNSIRAIWLNYYV